MDTLGNQGKLELDPKTLAGRFVCDTPENLYWCSKHLERYFSIAQDNNQVMQVICYYIPRIDTP